MPFIHYRLAYLCNLVVIDPCYMTLIQALFLTSTCEANKFNSTPATNAQKVYLS